MDLFHDPLTNLLPYDGDVRYLGPVYTAAESADHLQLLLTEIAWRNDEAVIFGRRIITARQAAWYGDERYAYTYSNVTKHALPWTAQLLGLKEHVEILLGTTFNSCLLNLYPSGKEGMAWHSDDEKALGRGSSIASLSFGAERTFAFKHRRTGEKRSLVLAAGSLLVMQGATQTHWLHRLPPTTRVHRPRVNLTFRTMVGQGE